MLKPVTKNEKLDFTLKVQIERGIDEIVYEAYEEKYSGFIDIWPILKTETNRVVLEIKSSKVPAATNRLSHPDAVRYHVVPGKGVKLLS